LTGTWILSLCSFFLQPPPFLLGALFNGVLPGFHNLKADFSVGEGQVQTPEGLC
jgi:hypothetical protein